MARGGQRLERVRDRRSRAARCERVRVGGPVVVQETLGGRSSTETTLAVLRFRNRLVIEAWLGAVPPAEARTRADAREHPIKGNTRTSAEGRSWAAQATEVSGLACRLHSVCAVHRPANVPASVVAGWNVLRRAEFAACGFLSRRAVSGEAGRRRELLRSASTGDVDEGDLVVARSVEAHNRFSRRLQDHATTLLVKLLMLARR